MARRKSRRDNESILVVLLEAPWQLNVFLAIVVFGVMRWVIPAQFNSQVLAPLSKIISGVAPLAAICFLIVAALSFFVKKKNADALASESSGQKTESDSIPLKPMSSKVPPNAVELNRYAVALRSSPYSASATQIHFAAIDVTISDP